jgi:threonine/homoserine/homoserine lactone efflux protein
MTQIECLAACLGLLMTPGPTNTLLTLSSAADGRSAAFRLVPAEVGGYLLMVVPLVLFGHTLLTAAPAAGTILRVAAAAWVAFLAAQLWLSASDSVARGRVTLPKVFITTTLNPKALLFGLFLLPSVQDARMFGTVALFVLTICTASTLWICLGRLVRGGRTAVIRRVAAVLLSALSARLILSVIA